MFRRAVTAVRMSVSPHAARVKDCLPLNSEALASLPAEDLQHLAKLNKEYNEPSTERRTRYPHDAYINTLGSVGLSLVGIHGLMKHGLVPTTPLDIFLASCDYQLILGAAFYGTRNVIVTRAERITPAQSEAYYAYADEMISSAARTEARA